MSRPLLTQPVKVAFLAGGLWLAWLALGASSRPAPRLRTEAVYGG